jgi:hypothetical protein
MPVNILEDEELEVIMNWRSLDLKAARREKVGPESAELAHFICLARTHISTPTIGQNSGHLFPPKEHT